MTDLEQKQTIAFSYQIAEANVKIWESQLGSEYVLNIHIMELFIVKPLNLKHCLLIG